MFTVDVKLKGAETILKDRGLNEGGKEQRFFS